MMWIVAAAVFAFVVAMAVAGEAWRERIFDSRKRDFVRRPPAAPARTSIRL
jgi:hypothetical protein